jgi:hypothetical protein
LFRAFRLGDFTQAERIRGTRLTEHVVIGKVIQLCRNMLEAV